MKNFEVGDMVACAFDDFHRVIEKIIEEKENSFVLEGKIGGWGKDKLNKKVFELDKKYMQDCYCIAQKHKFD